MYLIIRITELLKNFDSQNLCAAFIPRCKYHKHRGCHYADNCFAKTDWTAKIKHGSAGINPILNPWIKGSLLDEKLTASSRTQNSVTYTKEKLLHLDRQTSIKDKIYPSIVNQIILIL